MEADAHWMRTGPFAIWPTDGRMRLGGGRISFKTRRRTVFDVPLDQLSRITFPRYGLGGVIEFRVAGRRYRFTFQDMVGTAHIEGLGDVFMGDGANLAQAVGIGREFKRRLESAGVL